MLLDIKSRQAAGKPKSVSFMNLQPQIREFFGSMKSPPGVAIFNVVQGLDDSLAARQRLHEARR